MSYFDIGDKRNRLSLLQKYNYKCAYCGCDLTINTLHIDHIIPLRRTKYPQYRNPKEVRGENTIDNCNPCCITCNSSKSHYDIEDWRLKMYSDYDKIGIAFPRYKILKQLGLIVETYNKIIFHFEKVL